MVAKNQHYVPQFILKNFTLEDKSQIWVYDKVEKKKFVTQIRNVASETGFYNIKIENETYTIEPGLARIEEIVASIIEGIITYQSVGILTDTEKGYLAFFVALQFVRSKRYRDQFSEMTRAFRDAIKRKGWDSDAISQLQEPSAKQLKVHGIDAVFTCYQYVPYILNKTWRLFKTTKNNPFYISDNPIVLQNMLDFGLRGNLGFAVKGIEIYFPISSTLSMTFHCPFLKEIIMAGIRPEKLEELRQNDPFVKELMNGFEKGTVFSLIPESVINLNSLQIRSSSRFIYSEIDDFELVEEMLRNNPEFESGMKIKID